MLKFFWQIWHIEGSKPAALCFNNSCFFCNHHTEEGTENGGRLLTLNPPPPAHIDNWTAHRRKVNDVFLCLGKTWSKENYIKKQSMFESSGYNIWKVIKEMLYEQPSSNFDELQ